VRGSRCAIGLRPKDAAKLPPRQVANTLAELIIGGSLASTAVASLANPLAIHMQKALSLFEKGPLALVAGAGFEPATSGL
jgi:hypothetical protein